MTHPDNLPADSSSIWTKPSKIDPDLLSPHYRTIVRDVTNFLILLALAVTALFFFHMDDDSWNLPWSMIAWLVFMGVNGVWTYAIKDLKHYRKLENFRSGMNVGFVVLLFFITGGARNNFWYPAAFCIIGSSTTMYLVTGRFYWFSLVYPILYIVLYTVTNGAEADLPLFRVVGLFLFIIGISLLFFRLVGIVAQAELRLAEERETTGILRKAKEAAVAASEAKNNFIANVNHELRTPLTVISGFAELLSGNGHDQQSTKRYAETIRRNADHLNGIVSDILDLSRIDSGELVMDKTECNPAEEVSRVIEMFSESATQNGNDLKNVFNGPLPETVLADCRRLRQILINIVGNANKFTSGGRVELVTEYIPFSTESGQLVFTCIDTGCGISSEHHEKIFEPFTQEDSSTSRQFGGTGLGLFLSRKLARFHGGDLTLLRSEPNAGSTFRLVIPVEVRESRSPLRLVRDDGKEDGTKLSDQSTLRGKHILVAEDNLDGQLLLRRKFEALGANVTIASDGAEAVNRSREQKYHLVVLDLQMPVMSGYEACKQIQKEQPDLPIVALTANATSAEKEKALSSGFSSFVTKPISFDKLFSSLAGLLYGN